MYQLSGHFKRQGISELRHSHTIVRSDLSGYSLGLAMYLCQQCIEKELKAIILKLRERVDQRIAPSLLKKDLGHQLYPHIYQLYANHIVKIELPVVRSDGMIASYINDAPEPDPSRDAVTPKIMMRVWNDCLHNKLWKDRIWQNSVGYRMTQRDLDYLNSRQEEYISALFSLTGRSGIALPRISNRILHTPLLGSKTLDNAALSEYRANHLALGKNHHDRVLFDRYFHECQEFFSADAKSRLGQDFPYDKFLRRLVMEFGFQILLSHAPYYMFLFLHNMTGRYPERLGGDITSDLYESHADHVLFSVLVDIPYQLGQLHINSGRLDVLLDAGHRLGYW